MAYTASKRPTTKRKQQPTWWRGIWITVLVLFAATASALIQGNLALVGASLWARNTTELNEGPDLDGVRKLYVVDDRVWRGAQPGMTGYRSLAERGVTTVVDLRPGPDAHGDDPELRALGFEVVHIPITDGRPPSPSQVRELVAKAGDSEGRVFLHCGEGVGRAGTMSAAYKVTTGIASSSDVLRESLAVGVLTLEQIAFVNSLDDDGAHTAPAGAIAVSRFLDSPRQLFNTLV